jgi:activator of 2-hydroxyglutaryl-CoA dehydratase
MAAALSLTMEDFVAAARRATQARKISSMCTVFAESEVVSMAAGGVPRGELALGIHEAIAGRAAAMLRRIPVDRDIVFCGGAGLNSCLHDAIERALGEPVLVAPGPQLVSALGCAWLASG